MADDTSGRDPASRMPTYLDRFHSFRTEMDRVFDHFLGGIPAYGSLRNPPSTGQPARPAIDVKETQSAVEVHVDLPGMNENNVHLTIHNGVLTLRGEQKTERKDEGDNYHVMERSSGSFQRSIRLPDTIDEDKAQATFEKGVLLVTLPKRPDLLKGQKKIEIKSGQGA